jgi:hypothetical protein
MIHLLDIDAAGNTTGLCGATGVHTTLTDGITCRECLVANVEWTARENPDDVELAREMLAEFDKRIIPAGEIIVEVRHRGNTITVRRTTPMQIIIGNGPKVDTSAMHGKYGVYYNYELKQPDCTPEDAMRALGHYLHDRS